MQLQYGGGCSRGQIARSRLGGRGVEGKGKGKGKGRVQALETETQALKVKLLFAEADKRFAEMRSSEDFFNMGLQEVALLTLLPSASSYTPAKRLGSIWLVSICDWLESRPAGSSMRPHAIPRT